MRTTLCILAGSLIVAGAHGDILVTHSIIHTGQVIKATGGGVAIKVGENEFTVPRQDILSADIAKPDAFEKSLTALRAGKYQDALAGFKPIVDRYASLPLPWVEESLVRLGEAQVALKDYAGAKKTFDNFKTLYPQSALVPTIDAKLARILFEQGQPDKAMPAIQAVLEPLLKRESLTDEQETAVAEGLVLQGDCLAAAAKLDDALDSYLKVVTLFDVDADQTAAARFKAAKLFEQRGNWRRAKQSYDELLKENPNPTVADDAKKRLADLTKAHPE